MKKTFLSIILSLSTILTFADDGSRLWLKYDLIKDQKQKNAYVKFTKFVVNNSENPILQKAVEELQGGFQGLLGIKTPHIKSNTNQVDNTTPPTNETPHTNTFNTNGDDEDAAWKKFLEDSSKEEISDHTSPTQQQTQSEPQKDSGSDGSVNGGYPKARQGIELSA